MYKMNCYRCDKEMKYIENEEMERVELVEFKCSSCGEECLVPTSNPDLVKLEK